MIIDTSVLVALSFPGDARHEACRKLFSIGARRVVSEAVLTETAQILGRKGGPALEAKFLLSADADYEVTDLRASDRLRAAALVAKYHDADIGYVDASIAALAERFREPVIATLDRRHFQMIRPEGFPHFEIVP